MHMLHACNIMNMNISAPTKPYSLRSTDIGTRSAKLIWTIADPRPGLTNLTLFIYQVVNSVAQLNETVSLVSGNEIYFPFSKLKTVFFRKPVISKKKGEVWFTPMTKAPTPTEKNTTAPTPTEKIQQPLHPQKKYNSPYTHRKKYNSPYTHRKNTKAPTPTEKIQKESWQHKNATKNFDFTTITDRLRTVSWSNDSHETGLV